MPDKDEKTTDKPVEETKVEETKVEEPQAKEDVISPATPTNDTAAPADDTAAPADDTAAPADDTAAPAGTDQLGRQLYDVKCAKCGKQTQVPFKPSGDRPVYCRDCYLEQRKERVGGGPRR